MYKRVPIILSSLYISYFSILFFYPHLLLQIYNSKLRNLVIFSTLMRKQTRKKTAHWDDSKQQKINQEQQTYQKVNQNFKVLSKRPSHHLRIATVIKQQIRRPQTSKTLKRDYNALMELLDCNKMIMESLERSTISYRNMKYINTKNSCKNVYSPVLAEINLTQGKLSKKKYKKYDLQKFNNYMNNKEVKEDSQEAFVERALLKGIFEIQSLIPVEAKLHKKLSLFGQLVEEQKYKHVEQVKRMLEKQRTKGTNLTKNIQIYLINHYLIEKLMQKTFSDSSAIELKLKNNEIYCLIKNEMVGEIIKQQKFKQMLALMEEHEENSGKMVMSSKKWVKKKGIERVKVQKRSRNASEANTERTFKANKENEITMQFEKFYEMAQQKLQTAQLELSFPSNRKNNYHSVIQIKTRNNSGV